MSAALLALLSNIGIILFVVLYLYATTLYDGGTKWDAYRKSWDWIYNYWCDLIWPTTYLEEPNRASKWGIVANLVNCLSFLLFFIAFAFTYTSGHYWPYIIGISGAIAMLCGMIIFSEHHDKVITLLLLSIIPATVGVFYGLIEFQQQTALYLGYAMLFLLSINIFIFYTKYGERYLPFIQKIGYVFVLSWAFFINLTILN